MDLAKLYQLFLESTGVNTDTRKLKKGELYFALKGPNFNGNKLCAQALEKGAAWCITDEEADLEHDKILRVADSLLALQELAICHRQSFQFPVIGLTGSNGKTTNKELLHAALSTKYKTHSTPGNYNNHIGVPLTLLGTPTGTEMLIVEMGANHQGEIRELCKICQPDCGFITNIGKAHLEGFGGPEGVKKGKKELFDYLQSGNKPVFVNANDPVLMEISEGLNRILFGTENGQQLLVLGRPLNSGDRAALEWHATQQPEWNRIESRLFGGFNIPNLLCAATVATYFGCNPDAISRALSAYDPDNNRSQFSETTKNTLILDAYNANPSSMEAAVKHFAKLQHSRSKLAILGGMLEMGADEEKEHRSMHQLVKGLGLQTIFVGPQWSGVVEASDKWFTSTNEALSYLHEKNIDNRLILLKGSRGIALEKLVAAL